MSSASPLCRLIEYLHAKCAGRVLDCQPAVPLELREASHRLGNEVMILQKTAANLRRSADALSDLAEHMRVRKQ